MVSECFTAEGYVKRGVREITFYIARQVDTDPAEMKFSEQS